MTLHEITAYKTSDGNVIEDKHQALLQEFEIEKTKLIEAFMAEVGAKYTPRGRATAARILEDMIDACALNNLSIPKHPGVNHESLS